MTEIPDIHQPVSDLGHESLRRSMVAAIDDLETKTAQVSGALRLCRAAFSFAQTVLLNFTAMQQVVTDQAAEIAALTDRVAALEQPPPPAG